MGPGGFDFGKNEEKESFQKEEEEEEEEEEEAYTREAAATETASRSRNELTLDDLPPEAPVAAELPESESLELLGSVSGIVDKLVIVQSRAGSPAVDHGTVLWGEDRRAIGRVFETFGPVREALYSVRFNGAAEIEAAGVHTGMPVFLAPGCGGDTTVFVLTQELAKFKGCDASGKYDEPLRTSEEECSDDEREALRRAAKKKARTKRQKDKSGTTAGDADASSSATVAAGG
eukprot:UC1_evm1s1125